jgi:predicted branched-subunit amino acid permease
MSVLVTAGASQLTAVALLGSGADAISIVLATLVVNLRHIPLAISLAPLLASVSRTRKAMLAFFLTDPSYGMSVQRLQGRERGAVAYFLGSGASLYVSWVVSTIAGLLIGGAISDPASLGLHLVFPLSLMALLVSMVQSRAAVATVLMAGILALGARLLLPGTSYIPVAAIGGTLAGALLEARR